VELKNALPAVQEEIETITQAFVEARYSRREVVPEKVNFVKATWERIRRALQAGKKKER
jgi:hypothetical protein